MTAIPEKLPGMTEYLGPPTAARPQRAEGKGERRLGFRFKNVGSKVRK